jgi:hypothetical protein
MATEIVERTYESAVELFAHLCREYGLNPLAEGVILSHSEGYKKGLASNHGDPEHLWKGLKLPYTMDGFRQDVKSIMTPTIYRVQVGAFQQEQNAKNLLAELKRAGFDGFITKKQ